MAVGVNIAKTNLAVASHPPARIAIGKTNLSVASTSDVPPPPPVRRRPLFVNG
jgi:hypothetical protein